jgi:hypothetical protein
MFQRKAAILALGAALIAGPAFGDTDCKYKGTAYSPGFSQLPIWHPVPV